VIVREGSEAVIEVEVGGLAADQVARVGAGVASDGATTILGMRIRPADPAALSELGLAGGVRVIAIEPDSPAAEADVREGDILTRLGSRPIGRIRDLEGLGDELIPGASVPARLIRGGSPLFIGIRVPAADD